MPRSPAEFPLKNIVLKNSNTCICIFSQAGDLFEDHEENDFFCDYDVAKLTTVDRGHASRQHGCYTTLYLVNTSKRSNNCHKLSVHASTNFGGTGRPRQSSVVDHIAK